MFALLVFLIALLIFKVLNLCVMVSDLRLKVLHSCVTVLDLHVIALELCFDVLYLYCMVWDLYVGCLCNKWMPAGFLYSSRNHKKNI